MSPSAVKRHAITSNGSFFYEINQDCLSQERTLVKEVSYFFHGVPQISLVGPVESSSRCPA